MLRGSVVYKCGAEADAVYPEDEPEVLVRKQRDAAARVCPFCEGDARTVGEELVAGQGRLDLWRFRRVEDGDGRTAG